MNYSEGPGSTGYNYATLRDRLFTDKGQRMFIKARDHVQTLLKTAGAFRMGEAMAGFESSDTWESMACIDRMVELGEIVELERPSWGQYRVFTSPKVHNR